MTEMIRELARKQLAGEITQEEFEEASLALAQAPEVDATRFMLKALSYIDQNPRIVLSVVAALCHGAKHFIMTRPE